MSRSWIYMKLINTYFFCAAILSLTIFFLIVPALAQEDTGEEESIELLPPDFVSETYGFGLALPDDYIGFETSDDEGRWYLNIVGEMWQASALLTAEELSEDVVDVAGFWKLMKDRDPYMAENITYEKIDSICDTGAVQSRVEKFEPSGYILAITWVFVKDGIGYTLSGYPPPDGDNNEARNLALAIHDQFRWMTEEEIAEALPEIEETELPQGREF